jgi:16S rRNA (cytosine1402-N4)-methyltransferase
MRFVSPLSATAVLTTTSFFLPAIAGFQHPTHPDALTHSNRRYQTTSFLLKASKRQRDTQESDTDDYFDFVGEFATDYHAPVMLTECIDALLSCPRPDARIFVDGTLGGGGHSSALLQRLSPGDVVFGCDVDPEALVTASERLKEYMHHDGLEKPLFVAVESNFCNLATKLPTILHPVTNEPMLSDGVDGILLDLGVSSHQIDTAERGFAFLKDGPLDMRMGTNSAGGFTAADILNEFSEDEIRRILKRYGDEPRAKAIAASIVNHRPLATTKDLVQAVAAVVPEFARRGRRMGRSSTLARVFQSMRIVVNREDQVLEQALMEMCPALVREHGRLVVLSYHSMEDRATKRVIRDGTTSVRPTDERDLYGNYIGRPRPWKSLGKSQKATDQEVACNTRARSATLRVAERVTHVHIK